MRWERLFADLEARMSAGEREELAAEAAEHAIAARATVEVAARVLAHRGRTLTMRLRGGRAVTGTLADGAATWFLLVSGPTQTLVPVTGIVTVEGLSLPAVVVSEVERRLRATSVLRELALAQARVAIDLGAVRLTGEIASVGADHLDLRDESGRTRTVLLSAIEAVDAL